jgi:hypothetical protein
MGNITFSKIFSKTTPILGNSLYQLLPGLVNQVVAFFVVKQSGITTWGQVVALQLVYYIAVHIVSWGNKDYLLLQFSKYPTKINHYLQQSILTRAFIVLSIYPSLLGLVMLLSLNGISYMFLLLIQLET